MGPLGASIRALRPRCGLPDSTLAPVAQRVARYAPVSRALQHSGVDPLFCSESRLSALVLSLRAFLDRHFGRQAPPDSRAKLTVIPAAVFADLSEFGALAALFLACFRYAADNRLLPLDFDDEARAEQFIPLIFHAEKSLRKDHYFRVIKVFISPLLEQEEANAIRDIVQKHGAAIVSNSHVATHLVYPDPDGSREHQTDGQVLVRVRERATFGDDTFCLVHWFHHPDSYDDWVPDSEVLGHVYVPRQRKEREQWHVQARWIRDLDIHNEWMNELDYEMPTNFADFVGSSPKPAKLNVPANQQRSLVRIRLRMPKEDEVAKWSNQLEPSKRVGLVSLANGFAENHSDDETEAARKTMLYIDDLSAVRAVEDMDDEMLNESKGSSSEHDSDDSAEQTSKIPVGKGVFIPFFSKWFNMQSVHDIERKALPEFFEGCYESKNEQTYTEIRNFIVQTWRRSHDEYLSGTAVRRHLAGDACCILRVHGFLEHWGLINYDCSRQGTAAPSSFIPPPRLLPLRAGQEKYDSVVASPQLILDDGSKVQVRSGKIVKFGRDDEILESERMEPVLIRATDRTGQPSSMAESPAREPIEYHCDSCRSDCSAVRFHCATKADVDLCAKCYQTAKYSSSMKPRDFIQMISAGAHTGADETDGEVWTESETLLLLEALELYSDNWPLVSEHVGSKGKSQCLTHFLRLPIEEHFLSKTTEKWWGVAPPGPTEEASPVDMLRSAGARESALKTVSSSGCSAKTLTGQPLVFGDQISTIAPFAMILSSFSPLEIVKELANVLGVSSVRRRKRSFMELASQDCDDRARVDRMATDQLQDEAKEGIIDTFATNRLYKKLRRLVPSPAQFLRMDHGVRLARGAFFLVKHGAIPVSDIVQLRLDTSPRMLLQGDVSRVGVSQQPVDEEMKEESGNCMDANGSAHVPDENPGGVVKERDTMTIRSLIGNREADMESTTALVVASLAASSASASYRQQVEQVELDRLEHFLAEISVQKIERRLAHLSAITKYEEFACEYRSRKLNEEIRMCLNAKLLR